ncbi:MAG: response regulator [Draconibacterium sp.]|nr:response regulator [Draconibacterium sp.]
METVKGITGVETKNQFNPGINEKPSVEVIVIEDNHLVNMVLSKALNSTIKTIQNLKNIYIKFSRFHRGGDFLDYLENNDFSESRLIVFSDYFLEDSINGSQILKSIKQKKTDATVVIVSDTTNPHIPLDIVNLGAHSFIPKGNKAPVLCSGILFQKVV